MGHKPSIRSVIAYRNWKKGLNLDRRYKWETLDEDQRNLYDAAVAGIETLINNYVRKT